jgi:hypothetical protein
VLYGTSFEGGDVGRTRERARAESAIGGAAPDRDLRLAGLRDEIMNRIAPPNDSSSAGGWGLETIDGPATPPMARSFSRGGAARAPHLPPELLDRLSETLDRWQVRTARSANGAGRRRLRLQRLGGLGRGHQRRSLAARERRAPPAQLAASLLAIRPRHRVLRGDGRRGGDPADGGHHRGSSADGCGHERPRGLGTDRVLRRRHRLVRRRDRARRRRSTRLERVLGHRASARGHHRVVRGRRRSPPHERGAHRDADALHHLRRPVAHVHRGHRGARRNHARSGEPLRPLGRARRHRRRRRDQRHQLRLRALRRRDLAPRVPPLHRGRETSRTSARRCATSSATAAR